MEQSPSVLSLLIVLLLPTGLGVAGVLSALDRRGGAAALFALGWVVVVTVAGILLALHCSENDYSERCSSYRDHTFLLLLGGGFAIVAVMVLRSFPRVGTALLCLATGLGLVGFGVYAFGSDALAGS